MDNATNSQPARGNANRRDQDAPEMVPGHAYNRLNEYTQPLAKPVNEIQVHNKALRMTAVKHPGAHVNLVNSLAIVDTYLILHKRRSQNTEHILDWSGASMPWKRKVNRGINECILAGFMITIGKKGIAISEEGYRILEDYNSIFEEAKEIYTTKAAAKLNSLRINKLQNTY
jgi:hypothetical protein